jgi:DNA-binding PadR family transcriptional regulator
MKVNTPWNTQILVERHLGHPNQKVHGRRAGSAAGITSEQVDQLRFNAAFSGPSGRMIDTSASPDSKEGKLAQSFAEMERKGVVTKEESFGGEVVRYRLTDQGKKAIGFPPTPKTYAKKDVVQLQQTLEKAEAQAHKISGGLGIKLSLHEKAYLKQVGTRYNAQEELFKRRESEQALGKKTVDDVLKATKGLSTAQVRRKLEVKKDIVPAWRKNPRTGVTSPAYVEADIIGEIALPRKNDLGLSFPIHVRTGHAVSNRRPKKIGDALRYTAALDRVGKWDFGSLEDHAQAQTTFRAYESRLGGIRDREDEGAFGDLRFD